ncbi:GyrI-like domain-containing protein [Candidatus Micrarchaeota archaeon]|nr:GyrI-like domain-containing protein [Candidatus Micrarchaeota archaeon]MBU1166356.1 GyrI-like domain-containing protein [Candidatus Micrarchaeota archaeon]MBU1886243.1 GyrI-like domain-containing protein [Candidatus Micrarchaeota archaeon]
MKKLDFKKELKECYSAKEDEFSVVEVPENKFITIEGSGHPKEPEYQKAIEILYNVAYTIKMKKDLTKEGYFEYVVPPLECLYWFLNNSKNFGWRLMLLQPEFVTEETLEKAKELVKTKKSLDTSKVKLETFNEGKAIQTLHIGAYDKVGDTCKKLEQYIKDNGLEENGSWHEIYLSDPRKTAEDKLKTIVRRPVK